MNHYWMLPAVLLVLLAGCVRQPVQQAEVPAYAAADYEIAAATREARVRFTDVTEAAGLRFRHVTGAFGKKWMPETMGSGCGFLDYDGDGLLDMLLVNSCAWPGQATGEVPATQALYRNRGDGTFEDVTAAAGLDRTLYGMGCAFADYDGDGDTDIYLTAVGDNLLLRNDGGRYTDVTAAAGVVGNDPAPGAPPAWSTGAAWVDVDRDGHLDLFVVNYVKWSPETDIFTSLDGVTKSYATPEKYEGETCRLYRNRGDGTFADVSDTSGVRNAKGKSLGVCVADVDDDGWMDLIIANDTEPNLLFHNRGDGTFAEVGLAAGVGYDENGRARAGMGIDAADYRNDGKLGIAIGNFSREPVALFTQISRDFYQDLAGRARLTRPTLLSLTFGLCFADLDLDGFLDLVIANGHVEPEINRIQRDIHYGQRPQIFLNDHEGGFVEITDRAGEPFQRPLVGRGLACGDIDGDGDLDLLLTECGGPARLLRNDVERENRNCVRVRLVGARPNRDAIGARLVVWSGDLVQRRLVRTGSSYLSQSELAVHLGLGSHTRIDKLEVRWPSGRVDVFTELEPGRTYTIDEERRLAEDAATG